MTRLLQIMAGAKVGGAEKFFERLALALHNAGIEQHLAIGHNPDREKLLKDAGLTLSAHGFSGLFQLKSRHSLSRIVCNFHPDIALAWMGRAAKYMPKGNFVTAARLGGYYDLKYFRKCEHLVGNTQDICTYLRQQGWPKEKIWYLPNFVDDTPDLPLARAEFDTPDDAPLLLGLGRLHQNKAFDLGLEVMAKLPNIYYWIAGEGPKEKELRAQAKKLGIENRVRFLGWRTDIAALFATADIFLCTSRHEPLGNMMIEAWAYGVPVVAAAAQGPKGHITHRKNGLLSPVDNADEMAKNINLLTTDKSLYGELAKNGKQSYKQAHTENLVVSKYQEFFDKILKNK